MAGLSLQCCLRGCWPAAARGSRRVSVDTAGGDPNGTACAVDQRRRPLRRVRSCATDLVAGDTNASSTSSCATCGPARPPGQRRHAGGDPERRQLRPVDQRRRPLRRLPSARDRPGAGDANGTGDVFVRDLQPGPPPGPASTPPAATPNGASYAPSISADGRYVAFASRRDRPGRRRRQRRSRRLRARPAGRHDHPGQRRPAGGDAERRTATAPVDQRRRPLRRVRVRRDRPGRRTTPTASTTCSCATWQAGTTTRVSVDTAGGDAERRAAHLRRSAPTAATSPSSPARQTWSPATPTALRTTCSCATCRPAPPPGSASTPPAATPTATACVPRSAPTAATSRSRPTPATWSPATPTAVADVFVRDLRRRHHHPGQRRLPRRRAERLAASSASLDQRRRPLRRVRIRGNNLVPGDGPTGFISDVFVRAVVNTDRRFGRHPHVARGAPPRSP